MIQSNTIKLEISEAKWSMTLKVALNSPVPMEATSKQALNSSTPLTTVPQQTFNLFMSMTLHNYQHLKTNLYSV